MRSRTHWPTRESTRATTSRCSAENHRGFVEATVACSKLGANVLYLNTGFAGPQIAEVVAREQAAGLIYDDEFAPLIGDAGRRDQRFIACEGISRRISRSRRSRT